MPHFRRPADHLAGPAADHKLGLSRPGRYALPLCFELCRAAVVGSKIRDCLLDLIASHRLRLQANEKLVDRLSEPLTAALWLVSCLGQLLANGAQAVALAP